MHTRDPNSDIVAAIVRPRGCTRRGGEFRRRSPERAPRITRLSPSFDRSVRRPRLDSPVCTSRGTTRPRCRACRRARSGSASVLPDFERSAGLFLETRRIAIERQRNNVSFSVGRKSRSLRRESIAEHERCPRPRVLPLGLGRGGTPPFFRPQDCFFHLGQLAEVVGSSHVTNRPAGAAGSRWRPTGRAGPHYFQELRVRDLRPEIKNGPLMVTSRWARRFPAGSVSGNPSGTSALEFRILMLPVSPATW